MAKSYVAALLSLPAKGIPCELIELKRTQLQLRRDIKQQHAA